MSMHDEIPTAAEPQATPTLQQTMLLALGQVDSSLEQLLYACAGDEGWDAKDFDVGCGVELAMLHIQRLQAELPSDRDTFERMWFMAAAAVNLGVKVFSRPGTRYHRLLITAQQQFEVLAELVEFVDCAGRGPWVGGKSAGSANGPRLHDAITQRGAA